MRLQRQSCRSEFEKKRQIGQRGVDEALVVAGEEREGLTAGTEELS